MASTNSYPYVCPECGSHDLMVSCEIICKVIQDGDGEYDTQPSDDWYFDWKSPMTCQSCDFSEDVRRFEVPNQPIEEN